jgi:hypothetical protein
MWGTIRDFLTSDGGYWHEKVPFAVGFVFVIVEFCVRQFRGRPRAGVPALAYIFSEGMAITIMLVYGFSLAFNKTLAAVIADQERQDSCGCNVCRLRYPGCAHLQQMVFQRSG